MARGTNDYGRVEGGARHVAELPSYVTAPAGVLVMPAGDSILSILNPAASGFIAKVRRITVTLGADGGTFNDQPTFKIHRITAHGTGTAVTPRPFDTADAAAACTARSNLTVEPGYGVQLGVWMQNLYSDNAVGQKYAGTTTIEFRIFDYVSGGPGKPLTLREGEGLTIEVDVNPGGTLMTTVIEHTEEPA